jgi:hypothetical protein
MFVRRSVLTRWSRVNALVDRAVAPIDHVVAQRWDDRRTRVPTGHFARA